MSDVVTEDYHLLVKSGAHLPVNPMSHVIPFATSSSTESEWLTTSNDGNEYCRDIAPYTFGGSRSNLMTPGNFTALGNLVTDPEIPSLAYMLQEARAKCHGKPVDLLTMFAELEKSADLVKNVHSRTYQRARKVIDAAAKFRRGDLNATWRRMGRAARVADLLDIAGSIWLEYRFGWRLLVQDIESLHELYSRVGNTFAISYERGTFEHQSGPEQLLYRSSSSSLGICTKDMSASCRVYYDSKEWIRKTRIVRVGVMEEFSGNRFHYADPITTLYEIVPLSWVVDAFANVGSALKAWSPFISGRPVHQWMTDQLKVEIVRELTPTGQLTYYPRDAKFVKRDVQTASMGYEHKQRMPVSLQLPTIGFHPSYPDALKLLDIGAVMSSFGRRLMRYAERTILKM
jgi:hypothetical protein